MRHILFTALLLAPLAAFSADPAALTRDDIAFLQNAAIYNATEVRAAEIALARNLTPDERVYAEELKRHHAQANRELAALAKQKNVILSETIPSDRQEELVELGRHQDREFNERFLEERIDCHQRALRHLKDVREDSADADLRRYADSGLITVQQHLETAKRLEATY